MLSAMMMWASMAKLKLKALLTDEKGEVNIVAIVVLIGIAVLLALVFKEQIGKLITSLLKQITGKAGSAVTDPIKKG